MSSAGWSDQQMVAREAQPGLARPTCPLCGALTTSRYKLRHTVVFQCADSGCGLQFASPQLDDQGLGRAYAALYYPAEDDGPAVLENATEFEVQRFLRAIEEHVGSLRGKRVLDYGCGNGVLLRIVSESGAEAVGIEQSDTARKRISDSSWGRAYADLNAMKNREPMAEFDCIMMCDTIEHLREPWVELAKLRSLLSPGGCLFMTTPNSASLRSHLSGAGWDQRNNPTHFYYFNAQSLTTVVKRAGFGEVVQLPPITEYRHHGPLRRLFQRALARFGLHGGLLFTARH